MLFDVAHGLDVIFYLEVSFHGYVRQYTSEQYVFRC